MTAINTAINTAPTLTDLCAILNRLQKACTATFACKLEEARPQLRCWPQGRTAAAFRSGRNHSLTPHRTRCLKESGLFWVFPKDEKPKRTP